MLPLLAALIVVNAIVSASATHDAQPQGVGDEPGLAGSVVAPDGTPVAGGTVVLQSSVVPETTIDRAGRFRIVPNRSGLHLILVSVPGFAPYRMKVTVPMSRMLRLPVIRLAPATYFRVRFVSSAGEPITAPQLRRRSFDAGGHPLLDVAGDRTGEQSESEGVTTIGPLTRGITTLALDMPLFAQTRVPEFQVAGTVGVVDGGTIVVQRGSALHVEAIDAAGRPVPNVEVVLEDALPRSPLAFRPIRTNQQGRATFDRLAAGRYRVRTSVVDRCGRQTLYLTRLVSASGSGTLVTRVVIGGQASFRVTSSLGPARGVLVSASPDERSQRPPRKRTCPDVAARLTRTDTSRSVIFHRDRRSSPCICPAPRTCGEWTCPATGPTLRLSSLTGFCRSV
jgi:hypothetical protein